MGWTGGQYSLYRVALAAGVGAELFASAGSIAGGITGSIPGPMAGSTAGPIAGGWSAIALLAGAFLISAVLVLALAAGFRDRLAARLLAPLVLLAELAGRSPSAAHDLSAAVLDTFAGRTALLPALLLLLHARVPAAPFGALEARDRTDPRGGWQRPAVQTEIGWGLLLVALAAQLVDVLGILGPDGGAQVSAINRGFSFAGAGGALALASVGLAVTHMRAGAWIALALFGFAWLAAGGGAGAAGGRALLLIFACEPAWWGGRRLALARGDGPGRAEQPPSAQALKPARLFYDGDCGFCHRSVRFILAEELATPAALRLRFAPLGSDGFRACLARHPELDPGSLPDSIVLELEDGLVLTRSAAALEIASRLGGFWRGLALAGRIFPGGLLDAGYDAIARVRKRLFAQPKDACPILPPDLRARFDS